LNAPPFPMPVCLQFGTERGGKRARAWRIENSPVRGRDTRTLFGGGKGQKRFGVAAGRISGFVSAQAATAAGAVFRRFLFAR
jgi:hypothetical protein